MDRQSLVDAIKASGGKQWALAEVDGLWGRLELLQNTGRYGLLLSGIADANDKNNFLALVLEANFAYQFESRGLELMYEVKQDEHQASSIDFLRQIPEGRRVFFELRLLQQRRSITQLIDEQLRKYGVYKLFMGGNDEREEIIRLQGMILAKVQDKNGRPTKFFPAAVDQVNVVVIDVTKSILGMIDIHDCLLATHGDPAVEEVYRRQIFGLFQDDRPEYPSHIHDLARKYEHIRRTVHGVLFLFKEPNTGVLAYRLEQYLIWNPLLADHDGAKPVVEDLVRAIPTRPDR